MMKPISTPSTARQGREDVVAAHNLLIVEDDPNSRRALGELLTRLGYNCRVAADGEQALESLESFDPDAIVMDMMMPILDGLETTRRIKANAKTRNIPVFILSANATPEGIADAKGAGCDEFLGKPVSLQDLLKSLRHYLAG